MKNKGYKFCLFSVLSLICSVFIFFIVYKSTDINTEAKSQIKLMVELDKDAYIDVKDSNISEDTILNGQTDVISQTENITHNKVNKRYSYLVNGFSISGKYEDIDKIKNIDGVKDVYESVKLTSSDLSSGSTYDKADKVLSEYGYTGKGTVISIIDTGMDLENENFKEIDSSSAKLSEDNIKEVINETGRGEYVNSKIPYAYNYADGDLNIKNTSENHGMHVTGIAAANGDKFSGAAKDAQILAMKVKSTTEGGFYSEDLLLAIEDSVKLNADVINMSYGSDASVKSSDSLYKKAIDKAAELGVLCVNSAGNSGTSASKNKNSYPTNYSSIKDTSIVDNSSDVTLTVASMNDINEMSNFSSWGPAADLELKPEITAVGEDVRSTINDNKFAYLSGTSMAAPNVSGSEALIVEHMNKDFKNINTRKKTEICKNLAMNTADILYENDVPYSPRRQGSGAINVEKALNNYVTVTDERGKASLALKNIGSTKEFNIVITNYGSEDASYSISNNQKLYSEIVDDSKKIKEKEIENGIISFDKTSVNVKAYSSVIVKGKISVPDNFELNNFVEGYVKLESQDNKPSLNIPVLAFYGDYGDETILDYPIYDGKSIFKTTGLGKRSGKNFMYYGEYTDENDEKKIDKNLVAFSPNNDANQDSISLQTYFLRNSKYYEIEVLDENKNYIGNKVVYNNVIKNIYYDQSGNLNRQLQYYYNWDGTKYDMSTGKSVYVDDGLYYIRAKTKGYTENAKEQIIDMPVKVDTTPPVLDKMSVDRIDNNGQISYKLKWRADDNYSGVKLKASYMINDNRNNETEIENIKKEGDLYEAEVKLNKGEINKITLTIYDYAGNEEKGEFLYDACIDGEEETFGSDTPVKPQMVDALSFSKLKDGLVINVGGGKFKIKGYVREDVDSVFINDSEAEVSEGNLLKTVTLNEGNNNIHVIAKDIDKNIIFDKNYNVIYDKNKPEIVSILPEAENKIFSTEDESYEMNIKALDMTNVTCNVTNELTGEETTFELDSNGEGKADIPLNMGLNKLDVELSDEANNYSDTVKLLVVRVKDINQLNVGFVNIENTQSTATDVDDEGFINVIGYVTKKPKVLKINDINVKINDDFTVNQKVRLTPGLNKVKIYAEDDNGKVVEEYAYRLYFDNEAPIINLDLDIKNFSGGDFCTNNQIFLLKGYAEDNDSDYKVYLNNNMIINTQTGVVGSKDDSFKRSFAYRCILFPGDNYFKFRTVDRFGNDMVQVVKVVCIPPLGEMIENGGSIEEIEDDMSASGTPNADTFDNDKILVNIIIFALSVYIVLNNYKQKHT